MNNLKRESALPGFGLSLGVTSFYLSIFVLLPLLAILAKLPGIGISGIIDAVSTPRALSALKLSFGASLAAAVTNGIIGLVVAWVLVRYDFPTKRLWDGLIDLPFALPTAVAGIALTTLYAPNGWLGSALGAIGIKGAFSPFGIWIALTFVGFPFVVRSVQPVLEQLEPELEEASLSMGASRWQTFRLVIFPLLWPSVLAGCSLAFSRALGEYGSVVFISGNMPGKTEIVPLLIMTKLEQYDYSGAISLALVMLVASSLIMFVINSLQFMASRRAAKANT